MKRKKEENFPFDESIPSYEISNCFYIDEKFYSDDLFMVEVINYFLNIFPRGYPLEYVTIEKGSKKIMKIYAEKYNWIE
jgi:hypothetical protein